jgi:type I restriction enzyme, S subunit
VAGPGVVTGRYGTIGEVFYITEGIWPLNTTLFVKNFKGNEPRFVSYLLRTIDYASYSGKSGVPGVNRNDLHEIAVRLPPAPEQRSIASALHDVDNLLGAMDLLITKKRDLKQAAMQQLLTGRRRVPGFSGVPQGSNYSNDGSIPADWRVQKLGDVVEFLDGQRRPVKDSDRAKMHGEFPYYGASGVVDYVNDFIFDEDLILLGEDGENILSRNCRLAFRVSGKIWVNNHAHVLRPRVGVDIAYLNEYLENLNYGQYNTGTAQPKLNKRVCSGITVLCPPYEEQCAISVILSDMDAEIDVLERRRDKTRLLKQGMMQELLTGRIRLV